MTNKYTIIAGGYCGKCDYMNMVSLCEERIYDGKPKAGYTLYCQECGAKVDFEDYYGRVPEEEIVFYLGNVIKSIEGSKGYYFNREYVNSRIDMCKRVILSHIKEFCEDVWTDQCNPYILMVATKNLQDLMTLVREYDLRVEELHF